MTKHRVFLVCVGAVFVLISLLADINDIGGKTSTPGFGPTQWISMIAGIFTIVFSIFVPRNVIRIVAINLALLFAFLLFFDNLIYFFSPYLPEKFVRKISLPSMERFLEHRVTKKSTGNYWYSTEEHDFYKGRKGVSHFDEFGYRNPPGYISIQEPIDILLIGDSFVEGAESEITIADYLREWFPGIRTYSLGITGQGPPHWIKQMQHFLNSQFYQGPPQIVVFNYYAGNDITDAREYHKLQKLSNGYHFSFFRELTAVIQSLAFFSKRPHEYKGFTSSTLTVGSEEEQTVPYVLEQKLHEYDRIVAGYIKDSVKTVRSVSPDIKIVLVYIPTTSTLYGDDFSIQRRNADILRMWANEMGIIFVDPTEDLRKNASQHIIHGFNKQGHFNEKGYKIFARALQAKIKEIFFNSSVSGVAR